MQIALCDDNKLCLMELKEQLQAVSNEYDIVPFNDLNMFFSSVGSGSKYDVVFMDIDWGHKQTGIDAAEKLYRVSPNTKIIYVTGYGDRYSQNIFLQSANLSGFLTKPVDEDLLRANLKKVEDAIPLSCQPTIVIRQYGSIVSVPCLEIVHIESKARTIEVYTVGGVEITYGKLENIMESLPAWFVQCHKSYAVNMRQIQRILSNQIILKNGTRIPISRSKYNKTKEAYFTYIGEIF